MELMIASIFYMLSSAGMSVFNKLAVGAFPLPITLVCIQMSFTIVSVASKRSSVHIGSLRDALRWGLTVPALFAAMLVSSMFAMEHNTLGTVVVFRNIAPLFTLAIERMFRVPFQFSLETVAALLSIVAGVVLYHLSSLGLTRLGLLAICLNMAFAVLERLMQRHLMAQSPVDINKPGMMLLNNACGLLPCGVLMVVYGEPARWHVVASELTAPGALLILISCLNGLAISYAGLKVQQLVTATTFMVLTNVNKFAVILFGVVVLHDDITLLSTAGVLLAIGGGLWYAKARARMQEFSAAAMAPAIAPDRVKVHADEDEDQGADAEQGGSHMRHGDKRGEELRGLLGAEGGGGSGARRL